MAAVVGLSFVATGSLVPVTLHLPRWVETEIVLASWWAIAVVALTVVLYRGARLADDYVYRAPWDRPTEPVEDAPAPAKRSSSSSRAVGSALEWADPSGCVDAEGCIGALVGLVLAAAAFAAAWLFVELVAPVVFLLFYGLMARAIARATRDTHECRGNVGRAASWGTLWASTYMAPFAVVVWLLHAVMRARGIA
jgi:hypothetical protein